MFDNYGLKIGYKKIILKNQQIFNEMLISKKVPHMVKKRVCFCPICYFLGNIVEMFGNIIGKVQYRLTSFLVRVLQPETVEVTGKTCMPF